MTNIDYNSHQIAWDTGIIPPQESIYTDIHVIYVFTGWSARSA